MYEYGLLCGLCVWKRERWKNRDRNSISPSKLICENAGLSNILTLQGRFCLNLRVITWACKLCTLISNPPSFVVIIHTIQPAPAAHPARDSAFVCLLADKHVSSHSVLPPGTWLIEAYDTMFTVWQGLSYRDSWLTTTQDSTLGCGTATALLCQHLADMTLCMRSRPWPYRLSAQTKLLHCPLPRHVEWC